MKTKISILVLLALLSAACSHSASVKPSDTVASVVTETVIEQYVDDYITYVGIVNGSAVKKYSLKSGGILASVPVTKGQQVISGQILAELDRSDLELQQRAAKQQADAAYASYEKALSGTQEEDINSARLSVEKAQAAFDYVEKSYNDAKSLYDEGVISQSSFEEIEMNYNVTAKELAQAEEMLKKAETGARPEDVAAAKAQYEAANTSYEAAARQLDESVLRSDSDGYVADILYKEGELVPQGYPLVLVQSDEQVVTIGVTQEDVEKISEGMEATITLNGEAYNGHINSVSQVPDEGSRTFGTDVSVNASGKKLYIGSIGKVRIKTGQSKGILIDIPYIMNDGRHYVYICTNGQAVRRNVEIIKIYEDKALIEGLQKGDKLIISKTSGLREGTLVEEAKDRQVN